MQGVYFIGGIDTDIGKSIVTGVLARQLGKQGVSVITQKLIQTGDRDIAQDIVTHRRLMGVPLLPVDEQKLTMPCVLSYPASPHLSAKIDGVRLDFTHIADCTAKLAEQYQVVLLEGAGGLLVPLCDDGDDVFLTLDYVKQHNYPVILVTSGRLGSINHTLLSLEVLKQRQMTVYAVAYNEYHDTDTVISDETKRFLQAYLAKNYPQTLWWQIAVER